MEGAVETTVTGAQLAFMANPWPTAISVADFSSNYAEGSAPQGSGSIGGADQIWRWNTATASWTKYFYYSGRGTTQWRKSGESKETTDVIPGGEGFFFQRAASGASATLKISAPAK